MLGIFAGLAASAIWGGMYAVSKVVLETVPPFTLLSARLVLGALCLALFLPTTGFRLPSGAALPVLWAGFVGYGLSVGLQFVGTSLSTAANAALVTASSPVFIFFFAYWLLKERIAVRGVVALGLAMAGLVIVVDPSQAVLGKQMFWGNLALLGAAITWGLHSVLVKQASGKSDLLLLSFWALLAGLILSIPMSALELWHAGFPTVTWGTLAGVLYVGIVSTALAMYLWNLSLKLLPASQVSLLLFAQPVVGSLLGAFVLGEELGVGFAAGAALIGAGLLLSAGTGREAAAPRNAKPAA